MYRFRMSLARSKRLSRLRLPFSNDLILDFDTDINDGDIQLLLLLDVMLAHKIILDFNDSVLRSGIFRESLPTKYQGGHALFYNGKDY